MWYISDHLRCLANDMLDKFKAPNHALGKGINIWIQGFSKVLNTPLLMVRDYFHPNLVRLHTKRSLLSRNSWVNQLSKIFLLPQICSHLPKKTIKGNFLFLCSGEIYKQYHKKISWTMDLLHSWCNQGYCSWFDQLIRAF